MRRCDQEIRLLNVVTGKLFMPLEYISHPKRSRRDHYQVGRHGEGGGEERVRREWKDVMGGRD